MDPSVIQLVGLHAACNCYSVGSAFGDRWLLAHGDLIEKTSSRYILVHSPHLNFGFCFWVSFCFLVYCGRDHSFVKVLSHP